jgi:hypothetical protein
MGLGELIKSLFGGKDCKYTANILGKRICVHPDVAAALTRQKHNKSQEYYSEFCKYVGKVPLEINKFIVNGNPDEYIVCKYHPAAKK